MSMFKLSMIKSLTGAAAIASVLAGSLAPAQAEPFEGHGRGGYRTGQPHYAPAPAPRRGYVEERRHHDGDKIGKAVAIGVGALILGGIIANEADRHRRYD